MYTCINTIYLSTHINSANLKPLIHILAHFSLLQVGTYECPYLLPVRKRTDQKLIKYIFVFKYLYIFHCTRTFIYL